MAWFKYLFLYNPNLHSHAESSYNSNVSTPKSSTVVRVYINHFNLFLLFAIISFALVMVPALPVMHIRRDF